ncbi:hypothetical protein [Streptomyces sp. NPDC053427]|uniref:hypothetical protein n=1 Tax=Streptomyces sp. NPDC053427 TaxID=3365701 RepID=UPI0037CE8E9E
MLIVDAVLETVDTADFSFWPVADLPPYRPLALSPRMSLLELGTALATLTDYNSRASGDDRPVTDADEQIRRLLEAEKVIAPGGLRFHHTDIGITVSPGCCCGLEDWREWFDVLTGETPWLGHDPSPRIEHADTVIRLWPDGGDAVTAPSTRPLEIPVGDLAGILQSVRDGMHGFLSLTEQWAASHVPSLAMDLVTKLDKDLAISAPLPSDTANTCGRRQRVEGRASGDDHILGESW